MGNLQNVVYLSKAQLNTLISSGSITVDGKTVVFSEDDIYVTPQNDDVVVSNLQATQSIQIEHLSQLTDTNGEPYFGDDYNTVEENEPKNTGRKWLDGKHIYRKVITKDVTPSSSWQYYGALGHMETLISVSGTIKRSTNYVVPLVYAVGDANWDCSVEIQPNPDAGNTNALVYVRIGTSNGSSTHVIAIFEYTRDDEVV